MPLICYDTEIRDRLRKSPRLEVVKQANIIIAEYDAQGFQLTLRQLYYQFVARDLLPNKQAEYKRLGDIIVEGRMAGLIDWDAIVDRTRNLESLAHWTDPANIVTAVSQQFRVDKWARQPHRIEVWIEKDALIGVIENALEPSVLAGLIRTEIESLQEATAWEAAEEEETRGREQLAEIAEKYEEVTAWLEDHRDE